MTTKDIDEKETHDCFLRANGADPIGSYLSDPSRPPILHYQKCLKLMNYCMLDAFKNPTQETINKN